MNGHSCACDCVSVDLLSEWWLWVFVVSLAGGLWTLEVANAAIDAHELPSICTQLVEPLLTIDTWCGTINDLPLLLHVPPCCKVLPLDPFHAILLVLGKVLARLPHVRHVRPL